MGESTNGMGQLVGTFRTSGLGHSFMRHFSADYMQGTRLLFKTKEDAINFANKQGYEYFVQEPNERKFVPKAYANNFTHSPKKLKIVRTK